MVQINASSSLEKNECFKGVINRLVSFINVLAKKKKKSQRGFAFAISPSNKCF